MRREGLVRQDSIRTTVGNWIIVWMGSNEQRQKEQKENLDELSVKERE